MSCSVSSKNLTVGVVWIDSHSCGECNRPVQGASRGYRCRTPGHLNRTGPAIDDFVMRLVARRLAEPDTLATRTEGASPRLKALATELEEQHARISRAQRDYDAELIEASDLKRLRDKAKVAIDELEAQRLSLARGMGRAPVLGTRDPATAFMNADLATQRSTIDALCTITLHPQPRGRKGFDPASVTVTWRD